MGLDVGPLTDDSVANMCASNLRDAVEYQEGVAYLRLTGAAHRGVLQCRPWATPVPQGAVRTRTCPFEKKSRTSDPLRVGLRFSEGREPAYY